MKQQLEKNWGFRNLEKIIGILEEKKLLISGKMAGEKNGKS